LLDLLDGREGGAFGPRDDIAEETVGKGGELSKKRSHIPAKGGGRGRDVTV